MDSARQHVRRRLPRLLATTARRIATCRCDAKVRPRPASGRSSSVGLPRFFSVPCHPSTTPLFPAFPLPCPLFSLSLSPSPCPCSLFRPPAGHLPNEPHPSRPLWRTAVQPGVVHMQLLQKLLPSAACCVQGFCSLLASPSSWAPWRALLECTPCAPQFALQRQRRSAVSGGGAGRPAAGGGRPPAAGGRPPAAGGRPPAGGGKPAGGGGKRPPAGWGTPPVGGGRSPNGWGKPPAVGCMPPWPPDGGKPPVARGACDSARRLVVQACLLRSRNRRDSM